MNTNPIDEDEVAEDVFNLYDKLNLPHPTIYWCDSPYKFVLKRYIEPCKELSQYYVTSKIKGFNPAMRSEIWANCASYIFGQLIYESKHALVNPIQWGMFEDDIWAKYEGGDDVLDALYTLAKSACMWVCGDGEILISNRPDIITPTLIHFRDDWKVVIENGKRLKRRNFS